MHCLNFKVVSMTKQIPQGYKQTKVGVIPDDWEVEKLSVLISNFRGGAPLKPSDFTNDGIKVLPKGGIVPGGVLRISKDNQQYCSINYYEKYKNSSIDNTYVIVVLRDLIPSGPSIGLMVKYDSSEEYLLAQGVYGIRYNLTKIYENYIIQVSNSDWYRKLMNEIMVGSTQVHITNTEFLKQILPLPPIKEQEKIAEILITWDDAIAKQEQLIEQKRVFKKGIMQQIFSQKLRFKDDNGNDYPAWSNETLADVSDVRDGTHESPQYVEMGYPFITSKNLLENGNIDFINVNFISETDYNNFNKRSLVEISDILFGMIGTIGNPVIVKKTGFGIKNVALVKELQRLKNQYLIHYLRSYGAMKQFHQQNTGGTQKFIALGIIRQLTIKLPCIKEQNQIADLLTNIDDEITKQTEILEQLKLQKQSLMQKLLTGQVRVKYES